MLPSCLCTLRLKHHGAILGTSMVRSGNGGMVVLAQPPPFGAQLPVFVLRLTCEQPVHNLLITKLYPQFAHPWPVFSSRRGRAREEKEGGRTGAPFSARPPKRNPNEGGRVPLGFGKHARLPNYRGAAPSQSPNRKMILGFSCRMWSLRNS